MGPDPHERAIPMAKPNTTPAAGPASSTPAAAPAAAQGAAEAPHSPGAGSPGVQTTPTAPRQDPTRAAPEVQEDDGFAGLNQLAAQLAGLNLDTPSPAAPQKPAKAQLTPPSDIDEDDEDEDDGADLDQAARDKATPTSKADPANDPASTDFDPDAPVLPDTEDQDADGEAEDEQDDSAAAPDTKLKTENFKLREAKRQLKDQLEAAQKRLDEMEQQLATVPAAATTPAFTGYFAQVTQADDVANVEARLQADIDYLDDNADGYTYINQATQREVEVSKAQVRDLKRNLQAQLRNAPKVLDILTKHQTRAQEADTLARKKYPFVFDPKAKLNERVLDAAKEFPELTHSPAKALALGRLAIGKLVESGEYTLVKRVRPDAATRPTAAAPTRSTTSSAPPPTQGRSGPRSSAPQQGLGDRIARGDRDAMEEAAMAMITTSK